MLARYETPQQQMARLTRDAERFAEGHARLIANTEDRHRIKTSRHLFRAKVYNERLAPPQFDEINALFDRLVGEKLDGLLSELQAS